MIISCCSALRFLFFELTDKCNLNCRHCGSRCSICSNTFLHLTAVVRTLESVAEKYEPENIMVCLTGGEPLLHPDLFKIISAAGIEPQVLTVVHKNNISRLKDIFEYLTREKIYSWRLTNVDPIGRAKSDGSLLLSGPEMAEKLLHGMDYDDDDVITAADAAGFCDAARWNK